MSVALITGANKGIGLQTARQLGERGFTVVVGARDERRGQAATNELSATGLDARLVRLDVTDQACVADAARFVEQEIGHVDVLVNNAGVLFEREFPKPSEISIDIVRKTFDTNLFGAIAVTNAMLPLLRRSHAGRIVNISSWLGSLSTAADFDARWLILLAYNSSKAALNSATLQYARELRESGIAVNAVDPGHAATDINGNNGLRSAEEAASVVVEVATMDPSPTGVFFGPEGRHAW